MPLSFGSSTRRRRRGCAGGRRLLSPWLALLSCLLLLLPSTTALHAAADSPLVAAVEGGMEGVLEGGGSEEWEHAVGVMRMEISALWSLAWGSLWRKGGEEGGRRKEGGKEEGSLTYTASSSSPLALLEEEGGEEEGGWEDGDEREGGEGLVWREEEGEEGEEGGRRGGRWVHRGEEDEEEEDEEGDEGEEEAELWRIGEGEEEEEEEGYLSHFNQLYADEDEAEDQEEREEGMAAAAPADSPPSSPAVRIGPPSLSFLFLSALTSLSEAGGWRLYLVLFLALVLVLSTSLVVAYLSLTRLLGASPLEGWEQRGKERGRNKQEVFLRPEGEGPPIVDPSISPWPVYSGLLGYIFGGGFGEKKFVRFSSWQTEDDGEGGGVKRVPFEAYEAITYEEGIEAEDEDEDADEDGFDDEESEGEEQQEEESLWRKGKEEEEEKEEEGERERQQGSALEGSERQGEREALVRRREKVLGMDGVTGAGGNGGRKTARGAAS